MGVSKYCEKCRKTMDEDNFYTYKNGEKTEYCKKCLTMHIDNFDESTYLWLLEKMDVPYVPGEWNVLRDRAFAKNPQKMNGMSVFGKYLSKMKLKQWKNYGWADTAELQKESLERQQKADAERAASEEEIKQQYENGEITEAQYKTLMSTESQYAAAGSLNPYTGGTASTAPFLGVDNPYNENNFTVDIPDPAADLTDEDKIYLATKWGREYTPAQWVLLEVDYNEMMGSFDIQDADTKNTLKFLCKTNLKANEAIDHGDFDSFQKLTKVAESLRKTAKFTAAQNKEQKGNAVDCIGEFILLCEREEGFVPRYATDEPQDKVDMVLKDNNNYTYNLVTKELGFGQMIEDTLKKIILQNEARNEETGDLFDDDDEELSDKDILDYYEHIEEQRKEDALHIHGIEEDDE